MTPTTSEQCTNPSILGSIIDQSEALIVALSESGFIARIVSLIRQILVSLGVHESFDGPSPVDTCRALVAIVLTLVLYYICFGKRHLRRRRQLVQELRVVKEQLAFLQDRLQGEDDSSDGGADKQIRIFMDGAFDCCHYGHFNAFRLAKSLGTHLVVGINSDASITECKGAPLMDENERRTMVEACKFVDQVVPDCPYIMSKEYLDWVMKEYDIDYVVHGDDPCIVDGKDVYATAKATGNFRTIPRTEGVSTTDIVGRMLLLTKEHHMHGEEGKMLGSQSKFLTTSRMLQLFSVNVRSPTKGMRVIYMDGTWDLFHPGHVAMLERAKQRGDFLIVGIHSDIVVNKRRGVNLPLLNLHERVLSVLGCQHVDDVLIDAPYQVTPEMISSLDISEVVHGTNTDDDYDDTDEDLRYKHAKEAGIFAVIESPSDFRLENIVERIHRNQNAFQAKFERKIKAENQFYEQKHRGNLHTTGGQSVTNGSGE